jgi:hypothetical protein
MSAPPKIGFRALAQVMEAPRHWRLLVLWFGGLLLPTALVAFPLWQALGQQLDHSVHAAEWAQRFDLMAFGDVLGNTRRTGFSMENSFLLGLLFSLLLSPLLTGMVISTARARRSLGFVALFEGGFTEYGRMFRMLLWAALPLGAAAGLGSFLVKLAGRRAELAILESEADGYTRLAWLAMGLLLMVAHATVEAGRVQFAVDGQVRSVIRAWWRGTKLVFKRPVVTLGLYLIVTVLGFGVASLLGALRIRMPHASGMGFLGGFLVTQLLVMGTGWTRSARLLALAEVARPSD